MNLGDLIASSARAFPDKPAVIFNEEMMTYNQFFSLTACIAAKLAQDGVGPGDRVAVISKNVPEYLAVFAACERLGLVVVPINFRLTANEIHYILHESGARAVFLHAQAMSGVAEQLKGMSTGIGLWVSWRGEVPDGYRSWSQWLDGGTSAQFSNWVVVDKAPAYIFYTSGTTGRPKGIKQPLFDSVTHARINGDWTQRNFGFDEHSVYLSPAPSARSCRLASAIASRNTSASSNSAIASPSPRTTMSRTI